MVMYNTVMVISSLTAKQAKANLKKYGPNQIFKPSRVSFFSIARHEVTEPMILLLFTVGFFYGFWGGLRDAATIFIIIFLLVFAEVFNEYRAKKAIDSLSKLAAPLTMVWRDDQIVEVRSEEVVLGDLLVLSTGARVSADARVEKAFGLQVDESALTGESFPVDKNAGGVVSAGTIIVNGEGLAVVTATGSATKLGQIAATAKTVRPPKTPLQLAMKTLAGQLVYVAIFFSTVIPLIGWFRGGDLKTMFLTGLSLAFATIPEELPIIITMVLGLGAYTLSRNKFLVKKIKAAETLGSATVIVTDKTGTITENKMTIAAFYPDEPARIIRLARLALSEFALSPLDQAVKTRGAELGGFTGTIVNQRDFINGRKSRSVVRNSPEGRELFMSGAPEEIFSACRVVGNDIRRELERETGNGRRVIAVASRKLALDENDGQFAELEEGLDFGGLLSFEDPPRAGVKETISTAAAAGIRTIMVTGDHPATAGYIARQVGMISGDAKVLTGDELDKLSDQALAVVVRDISVFARSSPQHKYRIVQALQREKEIVAVTGDGINDALALSGADIGIAMGIRGTDVAKEAAEAVLADDNFVTITEGIFEGRKFFDNLLKGLKYYLSVKSALILIFLLPVLLGISMPFAPIQIILLELFMDLAASAGFVYEPKEKDIYSRKPHDPKARIFNVLTISDILIKGVVLFTAVMAVYFFALLNKMGIHETQTYAFAAWIFAHIFMAYIARSDREPLVELGIFSNLAINLWMICAVGSLLVGIYVPAISSRLQLVSIGPVSLALIALSTGMIVSLLEIRKRVFNR